MSARPNRFQSPLFGTAGLPPPRRSPATNQDRQMYIAGTNSSAYGSSAQLLPSVPSGGQKTYSGARTPDHIHAAFAAGPEGYGNGGDRPSHEDHPYPQHRNAPLSASTIATFSEKFQFASNPFFYGFNHPEPDDDLHTPNPIRDKKADKGGTFFTARGAINLGCLLLLFVGLVGLFAGYPIAVYYTREPPSNLGGYNLGGINASGQVPEVPGNFGLIDNDTPKDAYTRKSFEDGSEWDLVFSDEFNTDGRTFYPGDDPFWEAVDLHYWGTANLEWYDPEAVTTSGGYLNLTLSKKHTHGVEFQGGLLTSWNKFCFTGGYFEVSVSLPGRPDVPGLWPAVWTMGNLGRAGYGASVEGMWPYAYDSCDVGTLPNQTDPTTGGPEAARHSGNGPGGELSYLPGQRLSACTCPNDPTHPGPRRKDGSFVGRSAPEIDMFEAQVVIWEDKPGVNRSVAHVSQSGQWAPFDAAHNWTNTDETRTIYNKTITTVNEYTGAVYQESVSGLTLTNPGCYHQTEGCFSTYAFEYAPGFDGYITWVSDGKLAWTARASTVAADPRTNISARPVPQEPLYLIINLGMSRTFGDVDLEHLVFPTWMLVDYVRIYQPRGKRNIGCDPKDFPTQSYINRFPEAYTNPNLTTWVDDYKQVIPKNRLVDSCDG